VRERLAADGPQALHAELARRDPVTAERLKVADRARIARALEVIESTGRSLADWHRQGMPALLDPNRTVRIFLTPDRAELKARIDARFTAMLARGALEEVRALAERKLDPLLPAMKAHGVPWLRRHLLDEITLEAAAEKARQDTRHYAKRQFTWFRHQLSDWPQAAPDAARDTLELALRPQ
jgi:tRNA dimethylallyltransferase